MNEETTIYPTHSCFDDAMEFVDWMAVEFADEKEGLEGISLVHSINETQDGKRYAHAWVEDSSTDVAIFAGIFKGVKAYFGSPIKEFYARYNVQETTRYTVTEAIMNNLRTYNFGPWEEKYIALCANGDHAIVGQGEMHVRLLGTLPTKGIK
jgi:hypothetical protein